MRKLLIPSFLAVIFLFSACGEGETIVIPDNYPPPYDGIPTVLIENYVNRIFIDLIGREPLDAEMKEEVDTLKSRKLEASARIELIDKLMFDPTIRPGDSSFQIAYYKRIYELSKVRLLDGASQSEILQRIGIIRSEVEKDSLNGDIAAMQKGKERMAKLQAILDSEAEYREGTISIREMYARMLNNDLYDFINMNSFNFVNACFDDLFDRKPTSVEFDNGFKVIEYNQPAIIFGQSCQNKDEFIQILINSREYHEGMIRWAYQTLMAREGTSAEVNEIMGDFFNSADLQKVQRDIMTTDEYANFK